MKTPIETHAYATREDWLEARRQGIGGSDAAAAVGESPWKSPFALWSEKVGLIEPDDLSNNEAVEWGHRLEQPIADAYAERSGRRVERHDTPFAITKNSEYPWMFATLDAVQFDSDRPDEPGVLQIKTTSAYHGDQWDDEPPLHYQIQLMHEIAVSGFTWGTLACLIGGQKLVWWDAERDDDFITLLIVREKAFLELVQSETPPTPDGSEQTTAALKKLYPVDDGSIIELPPEAVAWDEQLVEAKAAEKAAKAVRDELENRIRAALGDAAEGRLPDGSAYSYKTQTTKYPAREATEKTFRVLRRRKAK